MHVSVNEAVKAFLLDADGLWDGGLNSLFFYQEVDGLEYYDEYITTQLKAKIKELNLKINCVEQVGGEGQGSDYWTVYKFEWFNGDVTYVKFEGWYASYVGSEFSEWKFVSPQPVTRIEYL